MILPTATSTDPLLLARQLILDVGTIAPVASASAISHPPTADTKPTPKLLNPPGDADPTTAEEEGPGTIYITTKRPAASSKTSKEDSSAGEEGEKGILAQAVANSNLSWWQLICVAIAGALVIGVAVWAVFRQRRKKREDEERKKEVEALDKAAEAEAGKESEGKAGDKRKSKGEGGEESDESGWSSEEYDSLSDGGTIRPRRRQRRRKRDRYRWGNRRRRRDSYYSSEEDESDYSYRPSRRSHRHNRHHRSPTPSPPPARSKRQTFRDSVFSTFQSMKHAAIRSKQDEMEKRLRKQLEDEERIELARQKKVREANEEIKREREWFELEKERERLRLEKERIQGRAGSGDSGEYLDLREGIRSEADSQRNYLSRLQIDHLLQLQDRAVEEQQPDKPHTPYRHLDDNRQSPLHLPRESGCHREEQLWILSGLHQVKN